MPSAAGARRSSAVLLVAVAVALGGCESGPGVEIMSPVEGQALAPGESVTVRVNAPGQTVLDIGGQLVEGDGTFEVTLPAADGLGFVSAGIPGHELVAVRSWLQGDFIPSGQWYPDSTVIRLGPDALSGGPDTLAGLIGRMLEGVELADSLITVDISLADVDIRSAIAERMEVELEVIGGRLRMRAVATDVFIKYHSENALFSTDGTARYAWLTIDADADLDTGGVALSNVTVDHADIAISDSLLPSWAMEGVVSFFDEEFVDAIIELTGQAAQRATVRVLDGIRPIPGIDLPRPIAQDSQLTAAGTDGATLEMHHQMKVNAVTPAVARDDQEVLARPMPRGTGAERATSLYVSRPLFNQLAFAIWDAGNFSGFHYTKSQLQELGIGELDFPYSQLSDVTLDLLMPPVLEWSDDGPRFEIGGIAMDIAINLSSDTRAWAAASVPVRLVPGDDGVRLLADPDREVRVSRVMFESLSDLADEKKCASLVSKAAPGVISDIFGTLPTITLPSLPITGIDGGPGPTIELAIDEIEVLDDAWRLDLSMNVR